MCKCMCKCSSNSIENKEKSLDLSRVEWVKHSFALKEYSMNLSGKDLNIVLINILYEMEQGPQYLKIY